MKKGKGVDYIPLDRKKFSKAILEYRKNIIQSKKSKWKIWEDQKSSFYDFEHNIFKTFNKDESIPNHPFFFDVTEYQMA